MKKLLSILIILLFALPGWAVNTCVISDTGGNWDSAATWTSCGGTYPQTGDSVVATATSGNLVVNVATSPLAGLDLTGYTATLSGTGYIYMSGGNLIYPNGFTNTHKRAVVIQGDVTVTVGSSQTIYLLENDSNTADVHLRLGSNVTTTADGTVYINRGTLTTNNYNITTNVFGDHSATDLSKTLALGSSTITLIGTNPKVSWTHGAPTVLANTATIIIPANSSTHDFGDADWNGASVTIAAASTAFPCTVGGANTFANLTLTGYNAALAGTFVFDGNQTITGTLTMTGTSQVKRPIIKSSSPGTPRTFTLTGGTVTAQDVDLQDIVVTGSPTINSTRVGDCGGNSGGVVSTPKTVYAGGISGAALAWTGNYWSATAEATYAARAAAVSLDNYPLPQDTAVFDNLSVSAAGKSITCGNTANYRAGGIDASALTTATTFYLYVAGYYGSLNLSGSGVTIAGNTSNVISLDAYRANITVTGAAFTQQMAVNSNGNVVSLGGNVSLAGAFTLTKGTFDLNGKTLTAPNISSSNSNTRAISDTAGNGKIVLNTLTGNALDTTTATGFSVNNAPDIDIGDSDNTLTGAVTFMGAGKTWGDLAIKKHAGNYDTIITGANTFGAVTQETPDATYQYSGLRLTSGTTTTVSSWAATGAALYPITLKAVTGGSAATISDTSGTNTMSYMTIQDITVSGGATFTMKNYTNGGNNTGWNYTRGIILQ